MHYLVKWEIDIEADTPEEAARAALAIQRDPNSIATAFDVTTVVSVDVTDLDEAADWPEPLPDEDRPLTASESCEATYEDFFKSLEQ